MKRILIILLFVFLCGCTPKAYFGPEITIIETMTYYKVCITPENPGCVTICTWVDINGEKAPFEIFTDTPIEPKQIIPSKNVFALLKGDINEK